RALWFTELRANKVGRITTSGELTEYPVPGPVGITVGKDGQLYTVSFTTNAVYRLNVIGEVTGQWTLPGAGGPLQIAAGFGLDLWVAETVGDQVFRLAAVGLGRWNGGA